MKFVPYNRIKKQNVMNWLLYVIIIGAIAGWLAGQLMKGRGFGLIGNIIVGILGAIIGGWLSDTLDISMGSGHLGNIITGTVGAVVLLFVAGLIKKA